MSIECKATNINDNAANHPRHQLYLHNLCHDSSLLLILQIIA